MKNKNWYQSLTRWERVRMFVAMKIAGDLITSAIGAAVMPFILKEDAK